MKRLIVAVLLLTAALTCRAAEVGSLRCEYLADPLGIDATRPRLSWVVSSSLRGDRQTAYRVLVASSPELLARGEGDLWDSGKTASGRSIQVEYGGKPLAGLAKCYWKVRVWDADDRPSRWSEPARWSMGPLCEEDWGRAEWIAARDEETWRNEWAEHLALVRRHRPDDLGLVRERLAPLRSFASDAQGILRRKEGRLGRFVCLRTGLL